MTLHVANHARTICCGGLTVVTQEAVANTYRPPGSSASVSLPAPAVLFGVATPPQCLDLQTSEIKYNLYAYSGSSNQKYVRASGCRPSTAGGG